ncbi:MAG: DNA-binding protein [Erysipelotrichaceae bacterium]|nr:DNA-binding protein [Erysipelotrichaceae bacterium]
MEHRQSGLTIYARLDKGEEILTSLTKLAEECQIVCAEVNGLGATDKFTVGAYSIPDKQYFRNTFEGVYEITSLHGTITRMDDKPYLHLHMTAGGLDGSVKGGHLNEAFISVTCELVIHASNGRINRQKDAETGINLFHFD